MSEPTDPTPASMEPAYTVRSIDAEDIAAINGNHARGGDVVGVRTFD